MLQVVGKHYCADGGIDNVNPIFRFKIHNFWNLYAFTEVKLPAKYNLTAKQKVEYCFMNKIRFMTMKVTKWSKSARQYVVFKVTISGGNPNNSLAFEVETPVRTTRNMLQQIIDTSSFEPHAELRFQVGFVASKKCLKRNLKFESFPQIYYLKLDFKVLGAINFLRKIRINKISEVSLTKPKFKTFVSGAGGLKFKSQAGK